MNRARCNSMGLVTVADLIVARVAEHSDHLFGVGGANIEDVYDAVQRVPGAMTGIVAKHEFGAATMADGYARTTNRLGVVAATSGGGALNLIAALGESFDSRVPVLALVGQPPLALEGRGAFQDTSGAPGRIDAERLFGAVSLYCEKVTDAAEVAKALDRAIDAAYSGGPAVLLLPKDIQTATVTDWPEPTPLVVRAAEPLPVADLFTAAMFLDEAAVHGSTVIIAGPEVARADARAELEVLAEALGAPVIVTPDARDVFPNRHPLFAGVAGIMGHRQIPELVATAELCVLVGATLPLTARGGLDTALAACPRVLHVGVEPPLVRADVRVPGPIGRVLLDLAAWVGSNGMPRTPTSPRPPVELEVPTATGPGIRYREAVMTLAAHLAPGTDVVVDAGNTGAAVVHYLPVPDGGRSVIALGMGGMGYAFGAGIGSALGRRRRTFVIAGDGSYFMHGHEIHTAVEHQAPVTFVVFNNNAHAMCLTREQLYFSGDYTFNRFTPAHIGAGVAATYPRLPAHTASTPAEFAAALDRTRDASGPVFIEVVCDPDEIPPFAPFVKELFA